MGLADWIIRAATNHPVRGREQWALAMQAEYASLTSGKLSWALGCWTAMFGWRLWVDAFYLVVMIATLSVWAFLPNDWWFWIIVVTEKIHVGMMTTTFGIMFLVSMGLSAFRPDRIVVTGLTMFAFENASAIIGFYEMKRYFHLTNLTDPFSSHWQRYNASYFDSELAVIGICIAGGLMGRWIGLQWRKHVSAAG